MAQGFWAILIPHGLAGGALSHIVSAPSAGQDEDGDELMDGSGAGASVAGAGSAEHEEGWSHKHTQWWFEFLESSGVKGVSKDVWQMVSVARVCVRVGVVVLICEQFLEFVRTIDAKFEKYDVEGALRGVQTRRNIRL